MAKKMQLGFTDFFKKFVSGDWKTKLSYLIMGFGLLFRGQLIKGGLYLVIELLFAIFIAFFGVHYLARLGSLGEVAMTEVGRDEFGLPIYGVVDNSFQILLFNVLTFAAIIFFLYLYVSSVKSCHAAEELEKMQGETPKFSAELKSYLDSKFHVTLLAIPVIGVLAFTVLPLITMILLAFTNFDFHHQPPGNLFTWTGLEIFKQIFMLGEGSTGIAYTFYKLLIWTLVWAVCATFLNYIFGIILALLINKKGIKFKKMWRTFFVITIAVPQFVTLLLMSKILADEGIVNQILISMSLKPVQFFTGSGLTAKITVIVINLWVGVPYTLLMASGILMNIPQELYESARIDGAGPVVMFFKITMPYMLFVTTPYLITQFVGNINNFNVIYLLSAGGPLSTEMYYAGETDLLITWLYKLALDQNMYNLASAIGIIVFVVCAVFSLLTYNFSGSVKREEEFQ